MSPPTSHGRSIRRHAGALLLYAGLTLLLTWPLVSHLTTHVTGDGIDDPALGWNLWWLKARLVDQVRLDVFDVDWLFFPVKINLAFYTLTPLNGLLSIPIQVASSVVVANNLLLILAFTLAGYGAYLLAYDLLGRAAAADAMGKEHQREFHAVQNWGALLAGLIYAFASSKLFYASLGQFNIASTHWIPFCVLYVLRTGRPHATYRDGAMAGLFLVFQAWAELTYASFLLIFIALYFLWRITLGRPDGHPWLPDAMRLMRRFLVAGLLFALGVAPFLWAMLPDLRQSPDLFASGGGFADVFSADLMGYLFPTRLHPLLGEWTAGLPFPNDKGQHIFIGYLAGALALMGFVLLMRSPQKRLRRAGLFWGGALLVFWLLTLGPEWRWAGESLGIPGPFALVSHLPIFSGNRYPSRYSVMLMLCTAMLAAWGAAWLLQRLGSQRARRSILLVGASLFIFEHLSTPLPLNDFRIPALFAQAQSEETTTLLELPTGWRNGARVLGRSDVVIMMQQWYQTDHGQRRLGGNTSRNPTYKFQYFTEAPLIGDLIALMNADDANPATSHIAAEVNATYDDIVARNRALAPFVLDFLDVGQVMVYVDHATDPLLRFIDDVLPVELVDEWQGPDWQGRPSTLRLYAVTTKSALPGWLVDLSTPAGNLHLAEGWSGVATGPGAVRYATQPSAELLVDIPTAGGELRLGWSGPANELGLRLNGHLLSQLERGESEAGMVSVLRIPPGMADEAVDRLSLTFSGDVLPAARAEPPPDANGWPVGRTGLFLPAGVNVVARSAGADVGGFAQIYVDGTDLGGVERGYHLVALSPTGSVLATDRFDTFADEAESSAMAAWIRQWPEQTVIVGAVADEASLHLTQDAVDALASIGVLGDLRNRFRWSHAFVGAKGSEAGEAIEEWGLLAPASAFVGPAVTGESVYGGVTTLEFIAAK